MIFVIALHEAHVGADIYIRRGKITDYGGGYWANVGPLSTTGIIAEDPKDDVARQWGWRLDNVTLLNATVSS